MKKFKKMIPVMIVLPFITAIVCLGIGPYYVSPTDTIKAVIQFITGEELVTKVMYTVIINSRLPRIILAICAGAALSVAGTTFQAVFSNPLAAPDTLGVSAGAAFGACVGLLLGVSGLNVQLLSFGGGITAVILTFLISQGKHQVTTTSLILSGVAISAIFGAGTSMVQVMADPTQTLPDITYWLMGSLGRANFTSILIALPLLVISIVMIYLFRWRLNTLTLSEWEATSLGVPVKFVRIIVIVAATFCTATSISMCGMVGWIGILVPHICRMTFGSDNRLIVPSAVSFGAVSLMILDTLARNIASGGLPISVLTALVGAPIFIVLLRKTGGTNI
ncbi:MAG: iron ABC transporter permease [Eubacteriales bacterium]